jgi:hypothetical protein
MAIGILVGTYSSIYIASPSLMWLEMRFGEAPSGAVASGREAPKAPKPAGAPKGEARKAPKSEARKAPKSKSSKPKKGRPKAGSRRRRPS